MIISASRRTDIPTYYSEWFMNRIKEKYVLVRNHRNIYQVSRIDLSPDIVDHIVFWTKNPKPMLDKLDKLKDYSYSFQFTLNSYGQDVEENVPSKSGQIIDTFKELSDKIGREKVLWRYDPIFINEKYNLEYHTQYFEKLAYQLKDFTEKCTISFIDNYSKIEKNIAPLNIQTMSDEQKRAIARNISTIAFNYGLKMDTCAEDIELCDLGITHAKCIDDKLIERIINCPMNVEKDKSQRLECGCVASIDIGSYNTCQNGCKYCYANHSVSSVKNNSLNYDSNSPLLCSVLTDKDKILDRSVKSIKNKQPFFSFNFGTDDQS